MMRIFIIQKQYKTPLFTSCNLPYNPDPNHLQLHVFYSELSCRISSVPWIFLQNVDQLYFIFLHLLAERDYNYTLGSRKMIQLTSQEKHCLSHLTIFFQDLDKGFFIYRIIKKNT